MIERLFEVVDLERNTFKLIHSELIQQVQCVEFNLKRIYAAMCQGDFDDNFHSLDNANLGKIVRELKRLDHSDGCPELMLMYGKEASNRKQEIDRQHYTIPNQRPKDKHCGKI